MTGEGIDEVGWPYLFFLLLLIGFTGGSYYLYDQIPFKRDERFEVLEGKMKPEIYEKLLEERRIREEYDRLRRAQTIRDNEA